MISVADERPDVSDAYRTSLEYLAANRLRRVSRTQIFNAVYGLFDDEVEESVVESHISKLRKKLRLALGYDPIDTRRYLGYQLTARSAKAASLPPPDFLWARWFVDLVPGRQHMADERQLAELVGHIHAEAHHELVGAEEALEIGL